MLSKWKLNNSPVTKVVFVIFISMLLTGLTEISQSAKPEGFEYLENANRAFIEIIEKAKPAVVTIGTTKKVKVQNPLEEMLPRWFSMPDIPEERKVHGLGSGVIVREDGYILTNYHVIKNAEEIRVILPDSRDFEAEIVGKDSKTDLAVVKIDGDNLPTLTLGNSDKLKTGEWVVAIGSPFGYTQTVTRGIVSATGRSRLPVTEYADFIQTDAPINRGNSGGALINISGELVGINTVIVGASGLSAGNVGVGFAISINLAKEIMRQLIEKGEVVRAWLGVTIQPISHELAQKFGLESTEGALVTEVVEDSPAEKAGIKPKDVIVEFDGIEIKNPNHLKNTVSTSEVGKEVEVTVIRDGEEKTLEVELAELTEEVLAKAQGRGSEKSYTSSDFGFSVQNLTEELAEKFGYEGKKGVIISEIKPGSPADDAGLQVGYLIQEVENSSVENVEEFRESMGEVESDKVLLRIRTPRGRTVYFVVNK